MSVERLTERRVAQIKPSVAFSFYYDEEDKGLCLKVAPSGRKSWYLKVDYRHGGRKVSTRLKLGDANFLSLTSARQKARAMKARVAQGLPPVEEAPRSRTFEKAWDDYRDELTAKGRSPRTIEGYGQVLRLHGAKILSMDLHELGSDDGRVLLVGIHRDLTRQGKKATADGLMRAVRAIYRRARRVNTSLPEVPTLAVSFNGIRRRNKVVSDLPAWASKVDALPNQVLADIYRAALLTGARRETILTARVADLDLDNGWWHVPKPKGGVSAAYDVPLSDWLLEIFTRRDNEARAIGSEWLFHSAHSEAGHIVEPKKRGLPSMHVHRHSFISFATDAGVEAVLRKLLVNHKLGGDAHSGYIRGSVLGESLRAAQQCITKYIQGRCYPAAGPNIVKLFG